MIFAGIKEALSADCWRWRRATLFFRGATRAGDQQVAAAHAETEADHAQPLRFD
jgi:hypothetical protein